MILSSRKISCSVVYHQNVNFSFTYYAINNSVIPFYQFPDIFIHQFAYYLTRSNLILQYLHAITYLCYLPLRVTWRILKDVFVNLIRIITSFGQPFDFDHFWNIFSISSSGTVSPRDEALILFSSLLIKRSRSIKASIENSDSGNLSICSLSCALVIILRYVDVQIYRNTHRNANYSESRSLIELNSPLIFPLLRKAAPIAQSVNPGFCRFWPV